MNSPYIGVHSSYIAVHYHLPLSYNSCKALEHKFFPNGYLPHEQPISTYFAAQQTAGTCDCWCGWINGLNADRSFTRRVACY